MHYILVCVAHFGCLSEGQWLANFPQAKIKAVGGGFRGLVRPCASIIGRLLIRQIFFFSLPFHAACQGNKVAAFSQDVCREECRETRY